MRCSRSRSKSMAWSESGTRRVRQTELKEHRAVEHKKMSAGTLSILRALRFDLGTVTLAALNLVFLATLVAVLAGGTETKAILTASGKQAASTPLDIQVPAETANLDVIQTQALFHASRTFYVPPDPAAVAVNVAPPDYRIVGAMSLPNKPTIAFLVHSQSGARSKVQKGDTLDGW